MTYALFILTQRIEPLPNAFQRKTPIENLRKDMQSKGVALGPSMDAYIDDLLPPSDAAQQPAQPAPRGQKSSRGSGGAPR